MNTFENSFSTNFYDTNQAPCFGVLVQQKQFIRTEREQPRFGIGSKNKINIQQFQFQQKIVYLKIQLQLQTIRDILTTKLINLKKNVFKRMKNIKSQEEINYVQEKLTYQYIDQIVDKLNNFVKKIEVKSKSKGFNSIILKASFYAENQMKILKNKKKSSDKRHSQTLRINSKNQDSIRIQDLGVEQSSSNSCLMNPKKKNKQLKKHRQQFNKNFDDFNQQMSQMLSAHQQFLKKF